MIMRTLLYVPGDNPRFLAKAASAEADAIIVDLEDAVAPAMKDAARDRLADAVPLVGEGGATVFVRINSTPDRFRQDAIAACRAGAFGIYYPKVESVEQLEILADLLEPIERELGRDKTMLVPLIETPKGVLAAQTLALGPRVFALTLGGEDLAFVMGAKPRPDVLSLPKQLVHFAAKAGGVYSFGLLRSVVDYTDVEGMEDAARQARDFGFDGSSCIHPRIVPVLNRAFSPSPEEIDWATGIVAANDRALAQGRGSHASNGVFIDAPIAARAQAVLEMARRIQTKK